jgi:hypothetical protein
MAVSKRKKKDGLKRAGCFFAVAIPVSFIVITLLAVLIVFLILRGEYRGWVDRFEGSHLSNDFIYVEDSEEIEKSLEEKILKFSQSEKDVESMELSTQEVFIAFADQFESSIPENVDVYRGYVDSDFGSWNIYLQTKHNERVLPWVIVNLNKDEGEGIQLYVSSISLGSYDLTDFGFKSVVDNVNKGLTDAFVLVNQSDFTGRVFENIELEPGVMVIKGRK